MKKFKIALVALLAVILAVLCVTGSTFSWFSRPKSLTGKQLDLPASANSSVADGLSFETYASSDGVTYGTTPVTDFSETAGLASGARKYYRTDIYNTGSDSQSASLYLQSLTLNANSEAFALGVNGPTKTYKSFSISESKVVSEIYKQNVYLGLESVEVGEGKLTNNIDFVHAWNDSGIIDDAYFSSSDASKKIIELVGKTGKYTDTSGWKSERTYNMYAVPIDSRCTKMKLKTINNDWISTEAEIYKDSGYKNNTIIFYEYGNNYYVDAVKSDFNSRLDTFYSSASVKKGETVDLAATYHGKSITYTSSDNNVATVSSAGVVTGVSEGIAVITVKVYGVYGDYIESKCTVSVYQSANEIKDVPVVTNVKVLPSEVDAHEVIHPSVSVYWYIKNDSGSDGLKYSIPELYLTL